MSAETIIVFDLDGVIADSITGLKQIYYSVLDSFDCTGNDAEFDLLNGPSLAEICAHLVKSHQLAVTPGHLLECYQKQLEKLPIATKPVAGALDIVRLLKAYGYRLALASSGSRLYVSQILEKFGLDHYFETIVCGDDVTQSKPHPEIYLKVKQQMGAGEFIAIEDSLNGLVAAHQAGMKTVHFCPDSSTPIKRSLPDYRIEKLRELEAIVSKQNWPVNCIAIASEPRLEALPANPAQNAQYQNQTLETEWQQAKQNNASLFDASLYCYLGHEWHNNRLNIYLQKSDYKNLWAKANLQHITEIQQLLQPFKPIGLSGLVINADSEVLLGRRSAQVTHFPGYWEALPAGTFSAASLDYKAHLAEEFHEETGLPESSIQQIRFFCLSYDHHYDLYDINCVIELKSSIDIKTLVSQEYTAFKLISLEDLLSLTLDHQDIVPNTLKLAFAYAKVMHNND